MLLLYLFRLWPFGDIPVPDISSDPHIPFSEDYARVPNTILYGHCWELAFFHNWQFLISECQVGSRQKYPSLLGLPAGQQQLSKGNLEVVEVTPQLSLPCALLWDLPCLFSLYYPKLLRRAHFWEDQFKTKTKPLRYKLHCWPPGLRTDPAFPSAQSLLLT